MIRLDLDGYSEEEILEYVLAGLMRRREELEERIAMLTGKRKPSPVLVAPPKHANGLGKRIAAKKVPARKISAAGRAAIAAAQRKRWAQKHTRKPMKRGARIQLVDDK